MVTKKRSARISFGPPISVTGGPFTDARVNSHVVGGLTQVTIHGPGGPFTPYTVVEGSKHQLRPAATIVGVTRSSQQFIGWDGQQYLLKPTLASLFADNLEPVAKVSGSTATPILPAIVSSAPPSPGYSDVERLAEQMGEWDRELKRVARVAQAKRQYREEDARKDFPDLTLWKAVDNSNLSKVRRREFFKNPCQTFGSKDGRFDLIGELTGRAASSAYDIYKQRPNRKKRSPKSNSL